MPNLEFADDAVLMTRFCLLAQAAIQTFALVASSFVWTVNFNKITYMGHGSLPFNMDLSPLTVGSHLVVHMLSFV